MSDKAADPMVATSEELWAAFFSGLKNINAYTNPPANMTEGLRSVYESGRRAPARTDMTIYNAVADAVCEVAEAAQTAFVKAGIAPGHWDSDNIVKDVSRGIADDIERLAEWVRQDAVATASEKRDSLPVPEVESQIVAWMKVLTCETPDSENGPAEYDCDIELLPDSDIAEKSGFTPLVPADYARTLARQLAEARDDIVAWTIAYSKVPAFHVDAKDFVRQVGDANRRAEQAEAARDLMRGRYDNEVLTGEMTEAALAVANDKIESLRIELDAARTKGGEHV